MIATPRTRNRRAPPPPEAPKPWRERLEEYRTAYANIPGAFRLVWNADKTSTIIMGLLTLISALLPISQAWVAALIINSVEESLRTGAGAIAGLQAAIPLLIAEFGLVLLGTVVSQVRRLIEHILNGRLGHSINVDIIRKALALDLQYFEDADFYDKLQNARREADYRALGIINGTFLFVQNVITLLTFIIALIAFNPLIALILFGATIPSFVAQGKYSNLYFRLLTWRAPEFRRMQYLEPIIPSKIGKPFLILRSWVLADTPNV